jgi:hypothetical protein
MQGTGQDHPSDAGAAVSSSVGPQRRALAARRLSSGRACRRPLRSPGATGCLEVILSTEAEVPRDRPMVHELWMWEDSGLHQVKLPRAGFLLTIGRRSTPARPCKPI